jgi:hypothetical protein
MEVELIEYATVCCQFNLMRAICYHKQAVKGKLKDMLSFGFCF